MSSEMDLDLWMAWCCNSNRKSQDAVDVIITNYYILHCQLHFSWLSWHLLSKSMHFILHSDSSHSWSPTTWSTLRPAFLKYSCAANAETHPSHDPAETDRLVLVIFYHPFISLLCFLEKKKQIVCFTETSFILHWRKRPLIFFLPYILYVDNAGIAHRWKEIVHYCHPGRWHMKLSSGACFE